MFKNFHRNDKNADNWDDYDREDYDGDYDIDYKEDDDFCYDTVEDYSDREKKAAAEHEGEEYEPEYAEAKEEIYTESPETEYVEIDETADEEAEETVYAEPAGEAGAEDAEASEYYEAQSSDEYEDDIYYMDDEYEEEDSSGKKGFFAKLLQSITNMSGMDKVMTATGAAVVVLAVITAAVYISAAGIDREIDQLATVGTALQGAEIPGNSGMVALADAKLAKYAAAQAALEAENQEEELKEYNESDYNRNVTVTLSMVSVYKDLKIKFTNNDSGKLISNVPFTVTLTTPSGKTETWTDDDQDGIIYKKDIEAGTYKVSVNALTDEKYSGYSLPSSAQSAEVKSEIAYKKIDVQNEIKKESEVNVAKEDTAKKDTVVESTIQDTVTWVESTEVTSTYREVLKSSITDPMTLAKSGSFMRMAEVVSVSEGDVTTQPSDTSQDEKAIVLDKTSATAYIDETAVITAALTGASVNEVKAASSDTAVAEVSVSGNTVTVKGKAAGSVTITITHPDKEDVTATCAVTVKNSPKTDKTTKLKDNSGNQLYVYENDAYREAVYADYYTFDSFYIKGDVKYTGWQTIDDKVYFYNGDGTKVTGEAVIQGVKYNFASDGTLVTGSGTMGIDVSKWNGTIDWNAVKNSGVSYVIIRCGYRGSSQGALIDDSTFATNIKGATAAGLKVGVYFFTQAVDEVEAVEEASMVLDRVSGYKISYPIFLDVEPSGGRGDKISADTRTAVCKAFCATIQNAGYTAGIYANKTWLTSKLNASSLSSYKIWLAQYAASPTYTGRYDMWQYKSTGKVSGISGNVDMNISYLGY